MLKILWLLLFSIFCNGINAQDTIQVQGRFAIGSDASCFNNQGTTYLSEKDAVWIPLSETFSYANYKQTAQEVVYINKYSHTDLFFQEAFSESISQYDTEFPDSFDSLGYLFQLCS